MTFAQKLKRLLRDRKQNAVARRVGIHPVTLGAYVNRGNMPAADIAARLARVLGVGLDWLMDDAKGWPPVRIAEEDGIESDAPAIAAA